VINGIIVSVVIARRDEYEILRCAQQHMYTIHPSASLWNGIWYQHAGRETAVASR